MGPRLGDGYLDTLLHALSLTDGGSAVEFGVASGRTLSLIAAKMPVVGFDSFEGLPEDWRAGFSKGRFACPVPDVPGAEIIVGLFDQTLPNWTQPDDLALVHIDCDLYSSTVTVLSHVELKPGMIVVFDEYHGYPGAPQHEEKAWLEHCKATGIRWTPVGYGPEQLAVRVL